MSLACVPARPASMPAPAPGTVEIWAASLEQPPAVLRSLAATLSPDERRRAASFAFPYLRRRFLAGRGFLRTVLGRYLGEPPASLTFSYGPQGKPSLAAAGAPVAFNLSHSADLAALAVTRGPAVGVDIERRRAITGLGTLARDCFTPIERAPLTVLTGRERERAFLERWTRKEAYLKATGAGLGTSLQSFDVIPAPTRLVLRTDGRVAAGRGWTVQDLHPAPGYVGAVAVEQPVVTLSLRWWAADGRGFVRGVER